MEQGTQQDRQLLKKLCYLLVCCMCVCVFVCVCVCVCVCVLCVCLCVYCVVFVCLQRQILYMVNYVNVCCKNKLFCPHIRLLVLQYTIYDVPVASSIH